LLANFWDVILAATINIEIVILIWGLS
jgi:hypothetical protein